MERQKEHRKPGPERARGKSGMKSMVLMSCVIPDNTTRLGSPHLKTGRAISTLHDVRGESWVLVSCRMSTWVGSPFFITPWVLSLHFLALTPYLLTPSDQQKRGHSLPTDTVRSPEEGRPAFAKSLGLAHTRKNAVKKAEINIMRKILPYCTPVPFIINRWLY